MEENGYTKSEVLKRDVQVQYSQQKNTREKEYLEWSQVPDPGDGRKWVHQVRGPQERCPGTVLTAEEYTREKE
jgi:hypothetical protein